jgi:hypothetical protein
VVDNSTMPRPMSLKQRFNSLLQGNGKGTKVSVARRWSFKTTTVKLESHESDLLELLEPVSACSKLQIQVPDCFERCKLIFISCRLIQYSRSPCSR